MEGKKGERKGGKMYGRQSGKMERMKEGCIDG